MEECLQDTMLFDYGAAHVRNRVKLVDEIMSNFTVIIIKEKLDESLVLLKHVLNLGKFLSFSFIFGDIYCFEIRKSVTLL